LLNRSYEQVSVCVALFCPSPFLAKSFSGQVLLRKVFLRKVLLRNVLLQNVLLRKIQSMQENLDAVRTAVLSGPGKRDLRLDLLRGIAQVLVSFSGIAMLVALPRSRPGTAACQFCLGPRRV
jgi:hypothetical protein